MARGAFGLLPNAFTDDLLEFPAVVVLPLIEAEESLVLAPFQSSDDESPMTDGADNFLEYSRSERYIR